MRVLITGVSGFVGRRLARWLKGRGHEVVGTHGEPDPPSGAGAADVEGVELAPLDVTRPGAVAALVERVRPDAVAHLAGLAHVGESWKRPAAYFQVNTLGTEAVLDAAAAAGGARVLLISSAEVYGAVPEDEQPIREDRPLAPQSPYALTKAAAERLALPRGAVVVRSFNLLGPGQSYRFALPSFAAQLATIRRQAAEPVIRVGNLSARRDFVHVDDAARALALLLEHGEPGRAYNLASGSARSIAWALDRLVEISGVDARIEIDPDRMRPVDVELLVGDASRLEALGWSEERGAEEAIRDLWTQIQGSDDRPADAAASAGAGE